LIEQPGGDGLGFWGGVSAGGEGVYVGAFLWRRGYVLNQIGESRDNLARGCAVFVRISGEGMTGGALGSATKGEGKVTVREERELGRGPFSEPGPK
jgi:hypothetical protein